MATTDISFITNSKNKPQGFVSSPVKLQIRFVQFWNQGERRRRWNKSIFFITGVRNIIFLLQKEANRWQYVSLSFSRLQRITKYQNICGLENKLIGIRIICHGHPWSQEDFLWIWCTFFLYFETYPFESESFSMLSILLLFSVNINP